MGGVQKYHDHNNYHTPLSTQGRASPPAASPKLKCQCLRQLAARLLAKDLNSQMLPLCHDLNSTAFFGGSWERWCKRYVYIDLFAKSKSWRKKASFQVDKKKRVLRKVSIAWHLLITLFLSPWLGLDNEGRNTIVIPTLHKGKNLKPTGNLWLPCCQSDLEQKWFFPAHFQPQSRQQTTVQRYNDTRYQIHVRYIRYIEVWALNHYCR